MKTVGRLATFGTFLALGLSAEGGADPLLSPAFFWMWNANLEVPKLVSQLEDMHAKGLRNVCIHPFPREFRKGKFSSAMSPDYLSQGYLDAFAAVVRRAGELGMHAYLYDEGGWPSGGACGQVAANDHEGRFRPWLATVGADGKAEVSVRPFPRRPPWPSVIEKGATESFLSLTHDAYARVFPEALGKTVKVAFTDEPQRPTGVDGVSLAWASDFAVVFKAKKGYDLVPHVPEMLRRADETDDRLARLRIDYNDVMADLFVDRYMLPIRDWCRRHGMLSGGHLNGEDVPERTAEYGHGNLFRSLRAMDVPGVDVIWRQLFPQTAYQEAVTLPFPRYASSIAHQQGNRYALSESFGIYGDSVTPAQMKWLVDYQLVRGINTFVFGYLAMSYARQWRLLFEPHSGTIAPYWDMEGHFFRYIERTAECLSHGRPATETVVLYDVRGFWAGGADRESAVWNHYATAKALDRMNCDYDICDDESIAAGEVQADGRLRIGKMAYRTVVLPTKKWMLASAREKLAAFAAAGGVVVEGGDLSRVPRTLSVSSVGHGAVDFRVLKRRDGKRAIYFVVNEYSWPREVTLSFPEGGRIVRYDPVDATCELATENGTFHRVFSGGESAIYLAGDVPPALPPSTFAENKIVLTDGWTVRKLVSHEAGAEDLEIRPCVDAERPMALGDWRKALGGDFSGKAVYRRRFDTVHGGRVRLDLGDVRWCASVRLDGKDLGVRFFGPFRWTVDLTSGSHEIEVTVANLLANQLGADSVRDRLIAEHPPCENYERYQRTFDHDNHESGLYGPVILEYEKNR